MLWKIAIIIVSTGGAMFLTALALGNKHDYGENNNLQSTLGIGGCAVMLSSICFSIPAHVYKKRAFSMSFKNEPAPQLRRSMVFSRPVPSLNLKIGL